MTSSARARIDGGTERPSALAVLRLTTSSSVNMPPVTLPPDRARLATRPDATG